MTEKLVNYFLSIFSSITNSPLGKEAIAFFLSLLPIIELRGGIIAGRALGINPITTFIICYIGNLLPVPFILWLIKGIMEKLRTSSIKSFRKFVNWLDKKVEKKKSSIEKYGFLGLILFVGIPLPGTGAWTGCLIASVLNMDKKKAFIATAIGVLMAGIIISVLSIGIFDGILSH